MGRVQLSRRDLDAVVFDMDGVVTRTAAVHAAAWKRLFDVYLERRGAREGSEYAPFDADTDYRNYVDGKPRYDGVASFLAARGIELPWGDPGDSSESETVCGLGNSKNVYFRSEIEEHGVRPFESTVDLVRQLQEHGFGTALISASRNAEAVLGAAGVGDLFPVRVDGLVAEELGLPGKPDPAVFVEAARRLGAVPARTAIVEDAIAGVEAGRRGQFALVIGVDRSGSDAPGLLENGADVAVSDLAEVSVDPDDTEGLPESAISAAEVVAGLDGRPTRGLPRLRRYADPDRERSGCGSAPVPDATGARASRRGVSGGHRERPRPRRRSAPRERGRPGLRGQPRVRRRCAR